MSLVGPLTDSHHHNGSHSVHDQAMALRWARLRSLRHMEEEKEKHRGPSWNKPSNTGWHHQPAFENRWGNWGSEGISYLWPPLQGLSDELGFLCDTRSQSPLGWEEKAVMRGVDWFRGGVAQSGLPWGRSTVLFQKTKGCQERKFPYDVLKNPCDEKNKLKFNS